MVKILSISLLLSLLLFYYLMLFQPLWIYRFTVEQLLFHFALNIHKHICCWTWNGFAIENFELPSIKLNKIYLTAKIVVKNLLFWSWTYLLIVEAKPPIFYLYKGIIMARLSLYTFMNKDSIQLIVIWAFWCYLPFRKIYCVWVFKSMHNLLISFSIIIKLKPF